MDNVSGSLELCLSKCDKGNLEENFSNLMILINELEFIRKELISSEIDKLIDIHKKKRFVTPSLEEGLVFFAPMKFDLSMELNLYLKSFMITQKQILDEFISIIYQLLFILKKDSEKGNFPKDFTKMIKLLKNDKLDFLEDELLVFLKNNALGLFKARFIRNKLKKRNNVLSDLWFIEDKYIVKMKYRLSELDLKDQLLKFFIEKGEIIPDVKEINFELQDMLDKYIYFSKEFYNLISSILHRKIILP